jgi:hypothetical protein
LHTEVAGRENQPPVYSWNLTLSLQIEAALDVSVSHETHRGRALFNPFITGHLLNKFPTLYITADLSHWLVVCERLLSHSIYDEEVVSHHGAASLPFESTRADVGSISNDGSPPVF